MPYVKALLLNFLPLILIFVIAIVSYFRTLIYKHKISSYLEKLIATFIIIINLFQSSILNSLFEMTSCTEILGSSYLSSYLDEECWQKSHLNMIFSLFIPSFIFYGAFLQLAYFSYMFKHREELHKPRHLRKIGFYTIGFTQKKFYWYFFSLIWELISNS